MCGSPLTEPAADARIAEPPDNEQGLYMKSAFLLTLAASLAASALPVSGQEPAERPGSFGLRSPGPMAGSLAHDVTREAARLAAAARDSPGAAQPGDKSGSSDWAGVRKVAPGTEVVVSLGGSDLILRRYFLSADNPGSRF